VSARAARAAEAGGADAAGAFGAVEAVEAVGDGPRADLRMVLLGVAAWAGGLVALLTPGWVGAALVAVGLAAAAGLWRRGRPVGTAVGAVLVAAAVAAGVMVRAEAHTTGPVARLAEQRAVATVTARVTSDPVTRKGRFGDFVVARLTVQEVVGRGHRFAVRTPVVLIGDDTWAHVELGSLVRSTARLTPPDEPSVGAVLTGPGPPAMLASPSELLAGAEAVRAGIRDAVRGSPDARALVPALVVGDDRTMSAAVVEAFRTCGLTHLAAVSGTNLTLVVGFLLLVARGVGVRGRWLTVVGVLGVVGFVVLARPEPSVVRAAAMGSVALLSLGRDGRARGARALGVATVVLLLVDPWLVVSPGFALSVLATAGILFLAPAFRDRLARWLPRWVAEAVAVPLAAQLACTPVVAGLSGEVSLVAVVANMAVAPMVAPATVLGLLGGLAYLVLPAAGALVGLVAGWCGGWIVLVAVHLARLPAASVAWTAEPLPLFLLTLLCVGVGWWSGWVLARRRRSACAVVVLALVVLRPLPTPGWPPDGWVLVACDVGQGDGLVLNAGGGRAVVVDTGPDPASIVRCLDRLDVAAVPVLVLTHFHADHVGGLEGVLREESVGEVLTTGLRDPPGGAAAVAVTTADAGVPVRVPVQGDVERVGAVTWQVLGPGAHSPGPGEQGSAANNASLVLLAEVQGVRVLLTGDIEPEAQAALARAYPSLRVGVLKVPHHGSRFQDTAWLTGLGARVALVSVGEDNDYGHPAPALVEALTDAGALVRRTDESGDVAVVVEGGRLRVRARRLRSAGSRRCGARRPRPGPAAGAGAPRRCARPRTRRSPWPPPRPPRRRGRGRWRPRRRPRPRTRRRTRGRSPPGTPGSASPTRCPRRPAPCRSSRPRTPPPRRRRWRRRGWPRRSPGPARRPAGCRWPRASASGTRSGCGRAWPTARPPPPTGSPSRWVRRRR
jgi:competence protein ComEC